MSGELESVRPSLNEDVIRHLFEIIYHAQVNPPWSYLSTLSLVCHQWARHAQALLFSHVRILNPKHLSSFLSATARADRGRELGDAVRIMTVVIHSTGYVNRVVSTSLPELLSRCPKLYELRITLEDLEAWPPTTLEELKQRSPPILSLRIRDGMETGIAARQLLHVWPSLKHLAVRSSSLGVSPIGMNEPSPPFSLYEFRWEGMHAASKNLILWILNYDEALLTKSYLRILHLSAVPSDDFDQDLAGHYGCHLHSLRIPTSNRFLIESAIQLKEIFLLRDEDLTKPLLFSLPSTVEHIAFSVMRGGAQAIDSVLQVKESGSALKRLKVVSLYRQSRDPWPFDWDGKSARARALGVELVRQDQRGLLVGGSEDMVATKKYPRPITIRQFDRMAAAVNNPLKVYSPPLDEDPPLLSPPPNSNTKNSSRESVEAPLSKSVASSRGTPHQQTIHLDAPYYVPRLWDYENDRPLEPIRLDDPSSDSFSPLKHDKWRSVRRSLFAFKDKISSTLEK
ncbi:hypothetical protein FRC17_004910 [Serendipita sp. 399]|nr:hypothetical protein FRC17_004910 [Serendipita sp. 399]